MADPYVEVFVTFEGGAEKTFEMRLDDYKKLKSDIQINRRPGSEATITITIAGGEFILPWGKVIFAEAFLRGDLSGEAVSQQLLAGPEAPLPQS